LLFFAAFQEFQKEHSPDNLVFFMSLAAASSTALINAA